MGSWVDHGQDGTGEPLSMMLRKGNAGSNTAADHIQVTKDALRQLPFHRRGGRIEFSVGYDLTETVRAAILKLAEPDWVCSLDQDERQRPNGR